MGPFKLYPEERHWWSFNDYGHVLDVVRARGAKRILEFGPGSSTLALIEGGATTIDTCEDNPDWAQVYEDRLAGRFPEIVRVHRYEPGTAGPLGLKGGYDLGLIDGPLGTQNRGPAIRYAIARCAAVLVPTEDRNPSHRAEIRSIAEAYGWSMTVTETGPLSGGFALLTPPAEKTEPSAVTVAMAEAERHVPLWKEDQLEHKHVTTHDEPAPVWPNTIPATPITPKRGRRRKGGGSRA